MIPRRNLRYSSSLLQMRRESPACSTVPFSASYGHPSNTPVAPTSLPSRRYTGAPSRVSGAVHGGHIRSVACPLPFDVTNFNAPQEPMKCELQPRYVHFDKHDRTSWTKRAAPRVCGGHRLRRHRSDFGRRKRRPDAVRRGIGAFVSSRSAHRDECAPTVRKATTGTLLGFVPCGARLQRELLSLWCRRSHRQSVHHERMQDPNRNIHALLCFGRRWSVSGLGRNATRSLASFPSIVVPPHIHPLSWPPH